MDARSKKKKLMVWFVVNLLTASAYSLAQKWQNETVANAKGDKFDHPFFQTMIQCIGNMCAFIMYAAKKRYFAKDEAKEHENEEYEHALVKNQNPNHLQSLDEIMNVTGVTN